jgi:signal peptidase I
MNKYLKLLKKTWWFIWEDDSLASWIVNILLAFVLIKFLIYPGLGLILGTSYPVVAVVSGSMEHHGSFDDWWVSDAMCPAKCSQSDWYAKLGISKEQFKTFIFSNGFNKGDIIVLTGTPPEKIGVGDVIVFKANRLSYPIIHRVIAKEDGIVTTKGDFNPDSGSEDKGITEGRYLGRAVFRIPFLGWIKIVFFDIIQSVGSALQFILSRITGV